MEEINEIEVWKKVEEFFVENFQTEKNPPIETLLFLIILLVYVAFSLLNNHAFLISIFFCL